MTAEIKPSNPRVVAGIPFEITQTVTITTDDIIQHLELASSSNDMSIFINAMGVMNQQYQSTTCVAADELTEEGKQFIDDLHFFMHSQDA
jgi:hypothetical protein